MPSTQQISTTPEDERDCWRTPPWLFKFLTARFGRFDIDLAASRENAMCERFLTKEDDALSVWWAASDAVTGFCNPPYSNPLPWAERALAEANDGFSSVWVMPTHCNQKWAALSQYATERIEFEGRVNFLKPDGTPMNSNRGGTQVLHFRAHDLGNTRLVWVNTRELMRRYA